MNLQQSTHSPSIIRTIATNLLNLFCLCFTAFLCVSVGGAVALKNQLGASSVNEEAIVYASGGLNLFFIVLAIIFVLKTIRDLYCRKKLAD
ncbi:hypothetical protein [Rothia sp. ZJ932]|uniref:hypothetical protein n=1 Tax=Rothia sp. ZJ932 TaxID=2810516 RepID=UPI0019686434|nr:hypothetical protein [Rothia sp. ZJ932]QRZ62233.1 hypothetical protein JR346_03755 [Rothia sp. ZJ932]